MTIAQNITKRILPIKKCNVHESFWESKRDALGLISHCWYEITKSFWNAFNQDNVKNKILCHSLSLSKSCLSKMIELRYTQIFHTIAHQPTIHHLLNFPLSNSWECCQKCSFAIWGRAQLNPARWCHHFKKWWDSTQEKKIWDVSSITLLQNMHKSSWSCNGIPLLSKFIFVGSYPKLFSSTKMRPWEEYEFAISQRSQFSNHTKLIKYAYSIVNKNESSSNHDHLSSPTFPMIA